ncbi:uncharacterized protein LOC125037580 isoform X1 [Penaeus chinensis]|uniref:uncharacterized protein LOC125037580 isoform X1 n=1 Tax=Penaeus chinensis TaxID=139456 RepID=UPI001FB74A2F|nr:uncharacterized protein LOC125037580 isoform X1 [Penaeus chinensis]
MTVVKSLSLLICVLTCSALRTFHAKRIGLEISHVSQRVKVWAGNGTQVKVDRDFIEEGKEAKWHELTPHIKGSENCPKGNFEDKNRCDEVKTVFIESNLETNWIIEPVTVYAGCSQYHLLELELDVKNLPTKLFWRPGKHSRNLSLTLKKSEDPVECYKIARESASQSWSDITLQLSSNEVPCVVKSATLNVSETCQTDQGQINRIMISSLSDVGKRTPSYISFSCDDQDTLLSRFFPLICLTVFALIAMVAVIAYFLRREMSSCGREALCCNDGAPQCVLPPNQHPKDSGSRGILHGQELQEENAYEYVSLNDFREAGGAEATELPPISSHDSENSLYWEQ